MKVLVLSSYPEKITPAILDDGHEIIVKSDRVDLEFTLKNSIDFIVSYGYRFIIKGELLSHFRNRILNLHISYLPWNRGADPNFWSFFENTPKGVTLHWIDQGVDTGDIVAQKIVLFDEDRHTLQSSYKELQDEIEALFKEKWAAIARNLVSSQIQTGSGSFHFARDKDSYMSLLPLGWETPVSEVVKLGRLKKENKLNWSAAHPHNKER